MTGYRRKLSITGLGLTNSHDAQQLLKAWPTGPTEEHAAHDPDRGCFQFAVERKHNRIGAFKMLCRAGLIAIGPDGRVKLTEAGREARGFYGFK